MMMMMSFVLPTLRLYCSIVYVGRPVPLYVPMHVYVPSKPDPVTASAYTTARPNDALPTTLPAVATADVTGGVAVVVVVDVLLATRLTTVVPVLTSDFCRTDHVTHYAATY